jgi:hypothetical protein
MFWFEIINTKTFCPNSFDLNVTDFSEGTASTILEMCLVYFQICEVTSFQTLVRSCLCTRLAETKKTVVCHLKVKRQISKMIKHPWNMLLLTYIFLRFCFLTECLPLTLLYDHTVRKSREVIRNHVYWFLQFSNSSVWRMCSICSRDGQLTTLWWRRALFSYNVKNYSKQYKNPVKTMIQNGRLGRI